jgi:hypothetical protein
MRMIRPNNEVRMTHWLHGLIVAMLIATMAALVYGHLGGGTQGLSLTKHYVTDYMKAAPHWPWLIVASFCFAILLSALALAFLMHGRRSWFTAGGCLLLTSAAMANFFVAYSPVRAIEQPPPPKHEWWTPTWWFTSKSARTEYERGQAEAYADVHYRATRLAIVAGVIGMVMLSAGALRSAETRAFGRWSLAAGVLMAALFLAGDRVPVHHGLWQRLGFVVMYVWLWGAYRLLVKPGAPQRQG